MSISWLAEQAHFTESTLLTPKRDSEYIISTGLYCSPSYALRSQAVMTSFSVATDLLRTSITRFGWDNKTKKKKKADTPLVMALPINLLRSIELTKIEKHYALPFIFLIGFISISASVTRFSFLTGVGAYSSNTSSTNGEMRQTYVHWGDIMVSLEVLGASAAFCLPSFRFLLRKTLCGGHRNLEKRQIHNPVQLKTWRGEERPSPDSNVSNQSGDLQRSGL